MSFSERLIRKLHRVAENPFVEIAMGLWLIFSGVSSLFVEVPHEFSILKLDARHGIVVFGFLIFARALAEGLENLEKGAEYVSEGTHERLRRFSSFLLLLLDNRYLKFATGVFLIVTGFTDAWELFLSYDVRGATWGVGLILIGLFMMSYILLGVYDGEEDMHLKLKERPVLRLFMSAHFKMGIAALVIAASVIEEVFYLQNNDDGAIMHRSAMTWSTVLFLKNTVRAAKLGLAARGES